MYNSGNDKLLQNLLYWDPTKTTKTYYPAVGISRKKIYAAQSRKQDFLLVGTDIYFMVKN